MVVDIDSLIWVTCTMHFSTSLAIYLGFIIEDKAFMNENNHVYVDILVSQFEEDADTIGGHIEWLPMAFPICGISHTIFGRLSSASSAMYAYICFPRMIYRNRMTHQYANCIPKEVLDFSGSVFHFLP